MKIGSSLREGEPTDLHYSDFNTLAHLFTFEFCLITFYADRKSVV